MSVDPLAGKFPTFSPYAYGNNNPLRYSDPTGMQSEDEVHQVQQPKAQLDTTGMRAEMKRLPEGLRKMQGKGFEGFDIQNKDKTAKRDEIGSWHPPMRDFGDPNDYDPYQMFKIELFDSWTESDWTIKNVIPASAHLKQSPGQCFKACKKILSNEGYKNIAQGERIYLVKEQKDELVTDKKGFSKGVEVINSYLEKGRPIIVGVHNEFGKGINKASGYTTDHFVVITGRGIDEGGRKYYNFFDVGTAKQDKGTSDLNRLYFKGNRLVG